MGRIDEDIKNGQFAPVYLLYGEESYLRRYYRNRLKRVLTSGDDDMNLSQYSGKEIETDEVIAQAQTFPFFASHRLIIIEDSGWFTSGNETMAAFMDQIPSETVILFSESEVDGRGKLYKAVKKNGVLCECAHPNEQRLTDWVLRALKREGKVIQRSAMAYFLESTGEDMECVSRELEKVIAYTYGSDTVNLEDVQAVCQQRPEDHVFKMIDAISSRRVNEALSYYGELLALRIEPRKILALMERQFRILLMIRDLRDQGFDRSTIITRTGMKPFIVTKSIAQSEGFPAESLRRILDACAETLLLMNSGRMEDRLGVELLIVSVMNRYL